MTGPIVLASGSRYRAELLAAAGIDVVVDPPSLDEAPFHRRFAELGPAGLALALALAKARDVAPRHPGQVVVAADQVGVLTRQDDDHVLLTKQSSLDGAVAQLTAIAAGTHDLVNGLVVLDRDGAAHSGVDVQRVRMRRYGEAEARAYVERFQPFDTSGSYRIEDQQALEADRSGSGLLDAVEGEHPSGVVGLPIPLLRRLLAEVDPFARRHTCAGRDDERTDQQWTT